MGNNSQNNWRNKMKERTKVCDWGWNDSPDDYRVTDCPFYQTWKRMLQRRLNLDGERKTVTVCEEWKSFWAFKRWAETKDWEGKKHLDKDILIPGNTDYRPDACLVVDQLINKQKVIDPRKYLDDHPYPQGVYVDQRNPMSVRYWSKIKRDGKTKRLGTFSTVEEASSAYCKKKAEYLRVLAEKQEPILKEALLRWADIYENA
jgi:hypothetical protein